jgi:hypothetical protein
MADAVRLVVSSDAVLYGVEPAVSSLEPMVEPDTTLAGVPATAVRRTPRMSAGWHL